MPTTRGKGAASTRNQSTLSFNSESARVTKPTRNTTPTSKKAQRIPEPAQGELEETTISTPEPEPKPEAQPQPDAEEISVAIRSSPSKRTPKQKKKKAIKSSASGKDEREAQAEKVTDAQIKKYWKAEEESRLAPRVHQQSVPLHEKILRHFDLSSQYGPCIGIQRLPRWKRANGLGLNPPVEVLAVLLREEDEKKSHGCGKLAYIDELGGGSVGIVDLEIYGDVHIASNTKNQYIANDERDRARRIPK